MKSSIKFLCIMLGLAVFFWAILPVLNDVSEKYLGVPVLEFKRGKNPFPNPLPYKGGRYDKVYERRIEGHV